LVQVFVPAWIIGGDKRSRRLALQTHARCRFRGQSKRAFEVFRSEDCLAVQHERFADRFFLRQLFFRQTERFGTVARATVSRNRLVKRKDTYRFGSSLLRILETALVIAGLDIVMGQLLDGALRSRAVLLESFGDVTMQTPSPDRIQLFIKHFANLVVREAERVA